ncbi:MAG TPA: ABC transporter ATP-binding protein [Casimicrobiaceae bacterium]|nr:ABC transporter ATP-binding protein [Casimicrobiaceae bacterium]
MDAIGVRLDGVSKRFSHRVKGEVYAARDVSLDVQPGEFLTLLGPSGCGKTTTLRMIAGFERPDAGRIFFGGQDVTGLPANDRGIGFVFQNYALFPHLSIFENIAYGLRVRGQTPEAIARAVGEVLALVGLSGYEQQFPAQLSGGEQQRVALARAIVIHPRVLLFDEPLSNLDAKLRVQMRAEIRDLQRRLAITTVYVTHDQEEAMAVSDRIAVMSRGSIVQLGTAQDLYHRPASMFVAQFIGRVNMVAGRVERTSSDGGTVTALGRLFKVRDVPAGVTAGDRVKLVLRPEAIELSRGTALDGATAAKVLSRTFLGEKIEYEVECLGEKLTSVRYNAGPGDLFGEGETIVLRCVDDTVIALKEAGEAAE